MKFELEDFNFNEQVELMNILNNYKEHTKVHNNKSIGFNEDTLYNFIEQNKQ